LLRRTFILAAIVELRKIVAGVVAELLGAIARLIRRNGALRF
jgi:hypothetical protein